MPNKDSVYAAECKQKFIPKKSFVNNVVVNKSENLCYMCNEIHPIFKCPVFNKMSLDYRWKFVKSKKLCVNCLRKNHFANKCLSNSTCKSCQKRHHTTLHRFYPNVENSNVNNAFCYSNSNSEIANSENVPTMRENIQLSTTCHLNCNEDNTLLSTALIKVKNSKGQFITCRALIDNGSQKSLITKNCATLLGLTGLVTNNSISGINKVQIKTSLTEVQLEFKSHFKETKYTCSALLIEKITSDLPNFEFKSNYWPHLQGLILADPTFFISSPIDILLGADVYTDLLLGQPISGEKGTPAAINSHLGWLVSGRIFSTKQRKSIVNCHLTVCLENQLKEFWELESIPQTQQRSKDDTACENFYKNTVTRNRSGRYTVKLPFKCENDFSDTASQALKRFNYLEAKLNKNESLREQYSSFMSEYLNLGHMEVIPPYQLEQQKSFYLPHHFVVKPDSTSTKLRVVFDASAKDCNGKSLNSTLHLGPRLQPELFSTLLKFRYFKIAISGDIEKMYRQIQVDGEDSDFQRIFWRFSPDDHIQTYRLLTVTYGTSSAPFLAVRTLQQLAMDEEVNFPDASKVLREDFYVDDLLSGSDSIPKAKQLVADLIMLLRKGGFNLRKWASNCAEVLEHIPNHALASHRDITIDEIPSQKILGLFWNSKEDTFQIKISPPNAVLSKRNLLSVIARIYDPLGFLSPTTIILKILLQDLWKNKLDWDDPMPKEIALTWKAFYSEMAQLSEIKIKRRLLPVDTPIKNVQLHGFCDASMKAYSAVCYIRAVHDDQVTVNIVAAKTRVAPLKATSLPRLELCAAHLLSKLYEAIVKSMNKFWDQVFLWSDSEIVLSWIRSDSLKDQFVRNRVAMINSLTESAIWNHVSGSSNSADCATRGIFPGKLLDCKLWWHGPTWLSEINSEVLTATNLIPDPVCLNSTTTCILEPHDNSAELCKRYSSYSRLVRVIAWCLRFIYNAKKQREERLKGTLQAQELKYSLICIVKQVQKCYFKAEIAALESKGVVSRNSDYLPLTPFLDSEKVLRVGGRLKNSTLPNDAKHPMLLPKGHHIIILIIEYYHKLTLHSGTSVVLSLIRQKFWFCAGRDTVRTILRKCVVCRKVNATTSSYLMGNLPKERVTPSRPFACVGVDFAGPIITKPNVPRSKVRLKSYIALFICLSTKAVHLELVSDLSSEAFIASFKRFISRRSLPSEVFSDNATNFKGAQRQLCTSRFTSNAVQDFVNNQQISWHFIPPLSPHFGGLWESNIKSTKRHLVKVCGSAVLNFEELTTLLCQIEACLNSRPLYPLSSDVNDLEALTPGHFLVGCPLLAIPEREPASTASLKSKWCLVQKLRSQFWTRWSRDYLQTLQSKSKWTISRMNVHIGDLILLKKENISSPLKWTLGRIVEVFPGNDGIIRVVRIKTATGEFTRPVTKICPLDIK